MGFFGNSKQADTLAEANSTTIISAGTVIDGNVSTSGNIRLEGTLKGNLTVSAKAVLSQGAVLLGNIIAQNAELGGQVRGIVEVSDLLVLKSTARIEGDIKTDKLLMEVGASFNGNCQMKTQLSSTIQE